MQQVSVPMFGDGQFPSTRKGLGLIEVCLGGFSKGSWGENWDT